MCQKIALLMGSDSDLPIVQKAVDELKDFGLAFEVHVMSAHRSPARAAEFAANARENGFSVLIAFAGMAAHLAGVLAAHTTLPVIGVPCKGGAADGLDALLATVQMPSGIPVATVALNGGANAAILAAQICALQNPQLAEKLSARKQSMDQALVEKTAKVQQQLYAD